jgi:hypothetical protein
VRLSRERASCGGEPGLDLEVGAASWQEGAFGGDPAAGDEEGTRLPWLGAGRHDAAFDRAQPGRALELAAHALECLQPVAEPRRVFLAARVGEVEQLPPDARQRDPRSVELLRTEHAG